MSFVIEKNVPLPEPRSRSSSYPFPEMEVGDSFLLAGDDVKLVGRVAVAARNYSKRGGRNCKFAIRKVENGARCWRVG